MRSNQLLRASHDDEAITEAGRLALELADLRGRLPDLETELADALAAGQDTPARRRLLATLLKRLLPPMYRDAAADDARRALGRRVLRPLLEIVTEADQTPDRAIVDLVGMLGNGDAAPALVRLAIRDKEPPRATRVPGRPTGVLRRAARRRRTCGDRCAARRAVRAGATRRSARPPRVRALCAAPNADHRFRAIAIWGLGRLSDAPAAPELIKALDDRQAEIVAAACLGLGRQATAGSLQPLFALADRSEAADRDATRRHHRAWPRVRAQRRRSRSRVAGARRAPRLRQIRSSRKRPRWRWPGRAIRAGYSRCSRARCCPAGSRCADASVPLEALAAWQADAAPPDEARQLAGPLHRRRRAAGRCRRPHRRT